MVCDRCTYVVSNILDELSLQSLSISLGIINFGNYQLSDSEMSLLENKFESVGFEIIQNHKAN